MKKVWTPLRRYRIVCLVAAGGALLSLLGFRLVGEAEALRAQLAFERHARILHHAIEERLERDVEVLRSIGRFYDASRLVEEGEFATFVEAPVRRRPGLRAIGWAPAEGGAGPSGGAGPFGQARPVRYLVTAPGEGGGLRTGLDLAAVPAVAEALARPGDGPAAVAAPAGWGGTDVVLLPIRRPPGHAFVVLDLGAVVSGVVDAHAAAGGRGDVEVEIATGLDGAPPAEIVWTAAIDVAGRARPVRFRPTEAYLATFRTRERWAALVSGLLATALLADLARRRLERRRREEAFRPLFHENPNPMLVFDVETLRILEANAAMVRLYGWTRDEVLSMTLEEIRPAEEVPRLREEIARLRADPSYRPDGVFRHRKKSGEGLDVRVFTTAIEYAGRPARLVVIRDVTDILRAERETTRTLSLLRSTLESTTDGILVVDLAGRIVLYNERFAEMWRIPRDVLDPLDDDRAIAYVLAQLRDPDGFVRRVRDLYAHPHADSFDVLEFQDGRVFERMSRPQVLDGRPVGRVWTFRDTTDRYRLLAAERAARDEAEAAVRARDLFLSIASHELKTPLTALHLQLQSALRALRRGREAGGAGADRLIERLETVETQAERLGRQIDTLLDVSRITAGRLDLRHREVDLAEVVREAVGRHASALRRVGAPLEVETPAPVPGLWDPDRIEQVVANLLSNAARHARGAAVRVAVEPPRPEMPGLARIVVEDRGPGVAEEDRGRVFERFERGTNGATALGGLGLGLYIVREIVRAHGGEVRIEDRPDGATGARFVIDLPLRPAAEAAPPAPRPTGDGRVLVVEDDLYIRLLLRQWLEEEGYHVSVASDGRDALETLRRTSSIGLVVLDMVMPVLDGAAFLEAKGREPSLAAIPVIALSTDEAIAARAVAAGAAAAFRKPIDGPKFLETVRSLCPISKASSPNAPH